MIINSFLRSEKSFPIKTFAISVIKTHVEIIKTRIAITHGTEKLPLASRSKPDKLHKPVNTGMSFLYFNTVWRKKWSIIVVRIATRWAFR